MTDNNEPQWNTDVDGRMKIVSDYVTVEWKFERYGKPLDEPRLRVYLDHQCDSWDIVGSYWPHDSDPGPEALQELIDDLKWAQSVVQLGPPVYNPEA